MHFATHKSYHRFNRSNTYKFTHFSQWGIIDEGKKNIVQIRIEPNHILNKHHYRHTISVNIRYAVSNRRQQMISKSCSCVRFGFRNELKTLHHHECSNILNEKESVLCECDQMQRFHPFNRWIDGKVFHPINMNFPGLKHHRMQTSLDSFFPPIKVFIHLSSFWWQMHIEHWESHWPTMTKLP